MVNNGQQVKQGSQLEVAYDMSIPSMPLIAVGSRQQVQHTLNHNWQQDRAINRLLKVMGLYKSSTRTKSTYLTLPITAHGVKQVHTLVPPLDYDTMAELLQADLKHTR